MNNRLYYRVITTSYGLKAFQYYGVSNTKPYMIGNLKSSRHEYCRWYAFMGFLKRKWPILMVLATLTIVMYFYISMRLK